MDSLRKFMLVFWRLLGKVIGAVWGRGFLRFWVTVVAFVTAMTCLPLAPTALANDGSYTLSIGDTIEFDLLEEDDLVGQYIIGSQGMVSLPLIGGVVIAGLTVADARERIRDTYIERQIFRAPTVDLSVVSYRKVTILGDVFKPGQYDYDPVMSAEQALGKAGGLSYTSVDPELRLLRRRELEGSKVSNAADLALSAAVYSRLKWQSMGGDGEMSLDLLPDDARAEVDPALFEGFADVERSLAKVEIEDYERQVSLVKEAIEESQLQLALIEERSEIARGAAETAKEAADRANELRERGVISAGDQLAARAALSTASASLVSVGESRTAVKRELGAFFRELSAIDAAYNAEIIGELQATTVEMKKLIATKRSIQDQLDLISHWITEGPTRDDQDRVNFVVRRMGEDGSLSFLKLEPFDEVLPGDILTVSVAPENLIQGSGQ